MFLRASIFPAFLALLAVVASSNAAFADARKGASGAMKTHHHGGVGAASNNSTRAYATVMKTMHQHMRASLAGDADVDFARQMIPHHQAAVDMAKIQQKYGRDEKLKHFNDWVIRAQEQEIAMMQNWLRRHDNGATSKVACDYYGEAMAAMHHGMMIDYTGDADMDYARGMIAHHQGAVDMASILLAQGKDFELNRLANDVYDSQTKEIAWLQRWLDAHGKTR